MTEDLLKAALLGALQGLTEFLPVSSTGHLVLAERALGVDQERFGLTFDAALHLGTLLALLAYFRLLWTTLISAWLGSVRSMSARDPNARLAWFVLLGTVPAAVAGFFLESRLERDLRSPWIVATMLVAVAGVFLLAEALGKRNRTERDLTLRDSVLIGVCQAIALVPGVSRSGITISAGLFRNLERPAAGTFAFLLAVPIIGGAGAKQLLDIMQEFREGKLRTEDAAFFLTGFVMSALIGYISIAFLMRFISTNTLRPFACYRIALGLAVFAVAAVISA